MQAQPLLEFRECPLLQPLEDEGTLSSLELDYEHMAHLLFVIERVNRGVQLEQMLDELYLSISQIIPCNRLGLAFLDDTGTTAIARWCRSDHPLRLTQGYQAPLNGSSLAVIRDTRQVRIINDLDQYLASHPGSVHTRLLVEEQMRSSLTCPLVVQNRVIGFLFFTSVRPNAYSSEQTRFYQHIASQISVLVEKARLTSALADYTMALQTQNQRMQRDLQLARQVQRTFVPAHPPVVTGLDLALIYEPADEVGGDLVEFLPLGDGRLLIFVADAMGHGVPAALAMAAVKATLLAVCRTTHDPAMILEQLNASLPPLLAQQFAAAFAVLLDPVVGGLKAARAGLPPPILLNGVTGECHSLDEGGLPLTLSEIEPYHTTQVPFDPQSTLVITTDGLTEALNAQGEQFGTARLLDCVRKCRHLPATDTLNSIIANLRGFQDGVSLRDDMAVVVARRMAEAAAKRLS